MQKKQKAVLALAVVTALFSIAVLLYPLAGTLYNARHLSTVRSQYLETVAQAEDDVLRRLRREARAYNRLIRGGAREAGAFDRAALQRARDGYKDQLDLLGDGVMGYVEIPKIGVELPILHGTEDETLLRGAGHLLGSSLPVGGKGTHAVLTAHSGMAASRMFSDLPELEEGDVFFLRVLGRRLGYRVDQICITAPEETDALRIEREEDLVTLVTCTPFGINTHRLLVRGRRIPEEALETAAQEAEREAPARHHSVWGSAYGQGIALGLAIVAAAAGSFWLGRAVVCHRKKNKKT